MVYCTLAECFYFPTWKKLPFTLGVKETQLNATFLFLGVFCYYSHLIMDTKFVVPSTSSCCGQVFISFTTSGVRFCLKSDLGASIHVLHNRNERADGKVSQLSSDQAIWVEELVGVIALCFWATHFRVVKKF